MKMTTLFTVCIFFWLAVFANGYQVNKNLEKRYVKKYGNGKDVQWDAVSKMTREQRAEICKSAHEKTNFGKLTDKDLKDTAVEDAYLKFSNSNFKKSHTQVLSCTKNNKEQYVYYLTKGLNKDSVIIVYPAKDSEANLEKYNEKQVFTFSKWEQISRIPILQKF